MSLLRCGVIVHRTSDSEQEKVRAMVALVRWPAILPLLSHAWRHVSQGDVFDDLGFSPKKRHP